MYRGILSNKGIMIDDDDALEYALKQCGIIQVRQNIKESKDSSSVIKLQTKFEDMFVEWFYSGDWIKDDDNE